MHVDFLTIGNKNDVDQFIEQLGAKYLPFKFMKTDEKGKFIQGSEQNYNVQILVRPVQLWDVVFPEQHKDLVLNTIFGESDGKMSLFGSEAKKYDKYVNLLRKMLKFSPLPTYDKSKAMPIHRANTHFIAIGVKDDRKEKDKEML